MKSRIVVDVNKTVKDLVHDMKNGTTFCTHYFFQGSSILFCEPGHRGLSGSHLFQYQRIAFSFVIYILVF